MKTALALISGAAALQSKTNSMQLCHSAAEDLVHAGSKISAGRLQSLYTTLSNACLNKKAKSASLMQSATNSQTVMLNEQCQHTAKELSQATRFGEREEEGLMPQSMSDASAHLGFGLTGNQNPNRNLIAELLERLVTNCNVVKAGQPSFVPHGTPGTVLQGGDTVDNMMPQTTTRFVNHGSNSGSISSGESSHGSTAAASGSDDDFAGSGSATASTVASDGQEPADAPMLGGAAEAGSADAPAPALFGGDDADADADVDVAAAPMTSTGGDAMGYEASNGYESATSDYEQASNGYEQASVESNGYEQASGSDYEQASAGGYESEAPSAYDEASNGYEQASENAYESEAAASGYEQEASASGYEQAASGYEQEASASGYDTTSEAGYEPSGYEESEQVSAYDAASASAGYEQASGSGYETASASGYEDMSAPASAGYEPSGYEEVSEASGYDTVSASAGYETASAGYEPSGYEEVSEASVAGYEPSGYEEMSGSAGYETPSASGYETASASGYEEVSASGYEATSGYETGYEAGTQRKRLTALSQKSGGKKQSNINSLINHLESDVATLQGTLKTLRGANRKTEAHPHALSNRKLSLKNAVKKSLENQECMDLAVKLRKSAAAVEKKSSSSTHQKSMERAFDEFSKKCLKDAAALEFFAS